MENSSVLVTNREGVGMKLGLGGIIPVPVRRAIVLALGGQWHGRVGFRASIRHLDSAGNVIWSDEIHNLFHDEGEKYFLARCLATNYAGYTATAAMVYMGLDNRVALAEGDVMPVTDEPSTFGYARQGLSTSGIGVGGQDWVITQPAAAFQAKSKQVTFNAAGGAWGPVKNMFIATTSDNSGRLLSSLALTQERTINNGESLTADFTLALSE
jgi:hypothetical protein